MDEEFVEPGDEGVDKAGGEKGSKQRKEVQDWWLSG